MKARCVALVHSRHWDNLWSPCPRTAADGSPFCARHRDAIEGALLGYYYANESKHQQKTKANRSHWRREIVRREQEAARAAGSQPPTAASDSRTAQAPAASAIAR